MRIKSIFAAMFLLLTGVQTGWAQNMTVRMKNNETHVYKVPQVAEVTFSENETGYEWVDLGLPSGTLWATCNVGANSPEEYGDYFAWGETQTKNVYNWGVYRLCGGSQNTMKKYCTSSNYGTVDGLTLLEAADDAAIANWGNEWQMPSQEQCQELFNSYFTTWEQMTLNDVTGIETKSEGEGLYKQVRVICKRKRY